MSLSDSDSQDLRKSIEALRSSHSGLEKEMIRFGVKQDHTAETIATLVSTVARHEAKDDERFAQHNGKLTDHGLALAKIQDVFGGSRKIGVAVLSGVAVVLGVLCYVLALVIQMTAKAGGP